MVYSLFHCSLLLALFPPFGSFNPRSTLRCHTLLATLPCTAGSSNPRSTLRCHTLLATLSRSAGSSTTCSSSHHHTLLVTLPRSAGSSTTRSSPPSHALQALPPLAPRHPLTLCRLFLASHRTTARFSLHHHTLHATLSRSKIPLNTPCFVTRKIMAEGAKKHDDFRLPT